MTTSNTTSTQSTYTTLNELTESLQSFFADTSNSREQTIAGLEQAKGQINLLLETLKDETED